MELDFRRKEFESKPTYGAEYSILQRDYNRDYNILSKIPQGLEGLRVVMIKELLENLPKRSRNNLLRKLNNQLKAD